MGLLKKTDKIFVAGHKGLVGSSILKILNDSQYKNIVLKTKNELDLTNEAQVKKFFIEEKIDVVFLAAAKVGGIEANNTYRADFIFQNMQIQNNVIWNAHLNNVHRLIFLGSSCVYPKYAPQPIQEEHLLTGLLETTNEPYAISKISGIKLIQSLREQYHRDYFSIMPTNLFGNNDLYHLENSHVIPALIMKFTDAIRLNKKEVVIWGDGSPLREFMYNIDLAEHICYISENMTFEDLSFSKLGEKKISHINIGSGFEISIKNLSEMIAKISNFKGIITYDIKKPNGTPRKLMDSSFYYNFSKKKQTGIKEFEQKLTETIYNYCNTNEGNDGK